MTSEAFRREGRDLLLEGDLYSAMFRIYRAIQFNRQQMPKPTAVEALPYELMLDYDNAITGTCTQAIRLDPALATAYQCRGSAYENKGDHEQCHRRLH